MSKKKLRHPQFALRGYANSEAYDNMPEYIFEVQKNCEYFVEWLMMMKMSSEIGILMHPGVLRPEPLISQSLEEMGRSG